MDIASLSIKGWNTVKIVIRHSAWSGDPHLITSTVKILGKFKLINRQGQYHIQSMEEKVNIGSWTNQGYPFYSGTAVYSTDFYLDSVPRLGVLECHAISDCMEVYVNGGYVGTRVWKPWNLDISKFLVQGLNTLTIKITNSAVNFMEAVEKPSGLLGEVEITYC